MTKIAPSTECQNNIQLGFKIDNKIGDMDIGQSIIIENGYVLGVEAVEGTDNLIKRCQLFKASTPSGVLIKVKKGGQEIRINMPVIGEATIRNLFEAKFLGVALEANTIFIINKEKIIETADKLGLFISGI